MNFAREDGLTVAIRGGGHNGAGLSVCDQGLVIDLSPMKGVRVDPANRTVRVEPVARRATWIMPAMRLDWQCQPELSPRLASQVSP